METKETKTVNSLKHTIYTKDSEGNIFDIEIRLSDDCKNGHNDFAITATAYKNKSRSDRSYLYGGCAHDEILKVHPELKIFVDLHLSDFRGVPMYAVENGFFHLEEKNYRAAQEHARATDDEFEILKTAKDKDYYSHLLAELGIVDRWQKEAKQAIAILEQMTGQKFEDNSTKLPPMPALSPDIAKKIRDGYYSAESIRERETKKEIERKLKLEKKLMEDCDKDILKATTERDVKLCVLRSGLSLKNFIFYSHSCEGVFNWLEYERKVTQEEFDAFLSNLSQHYLPTDITFKLGNKGK